MKKNIISIIFATSFVLLISLNVFAAMAMPRYGINEKTKECAEFFMGDECAKCTLPEGWEMIEESQCPTGYKEIQKNSVCTPRKDSFCCTVQHSGMYGDCEDVVVNDIEQKCAFVEDINKCNKLPKNWHQAKEIDFLGRLCPSLEHEWAEEPLNCETGVIENNNNIDDKRQNLNVISIVGVSIGGIILLTILWFFSTKRR